MTQPGAPLLTYSLATSPYPVLTSASSTEPSLANITIVVSCPYALGSCTVSQIGVHLPVGKDAEATNLTATAPPASAASISSSDDAAWTSSAGIGAGTFLFTPPGGSVVVSDQSLTIEISGIHVSTVVGTAGVVVNEWAAQQAALPASSPPSGQETIAIAKFPSGFYAYGFAPDQPQVEPGDTVTLTWFGSANAIFTIAYDEDVPPVDVRPPAWTSPQLYAPTTFELTATASEAGQTVSINQTTTVTVAEPQLAQFYADPSDIDYQQSVVLNWQAVNADGVYLLTGETGKEKLGKASDSTNPQELQPVYGTMYWMQAYRAEGQAEVTSTPQPLALTYNPMSITFTADPSPTTVENPETTLSWDVVNATSVTVAGEPVDASGSCPQTPTPPSSTYDLVATWVDGSEQRASVTVPTSVAYIGGYSVALAPAPGRPGLDVVLTVTAENTTALSLPLAMMRFTQPGGNYWTQPVTGMGLRTQGTDWGVPLYFEDAPPDLSDWPNIGLIFDLQVSGPGAPPESTGNVAMYRGSFD